MAEGVWFLLNKKTISILAAPQRYIAFVGILLLLGHCNHSRQQLYWSLDQNCDSHIVIEAMRKESKKKAKCEKTILFMQCRLSLRLLQFIPSISQKLKTLYLLCLLPYDSMIHR